MKVYFTDELLVGEVGLEDVAPTHLISKSLVNLKLNFNLSIVN
jgi:hypothetical protein